MSDQECQELIDKLLSALGLEFKPAKDCDFIDGWYMWRNSPDWPVDSYAVYEVVENMILEPEPADSYGSAWEMSEHKAYGELAGPLLGR